MKKIFLILTVSLAIISCDTSKEPEYSYDDIHNCLPIPEDVPKTFKSGDSIEWDCEMASFYYDGKLKFYYDETGGLVAIEKER